MSLTPDYKKLNDNEILYFRIITLQFFCDVLRKRLVQNQMPDHSSQPSYLPGYVTNPPGYMMHELTGQRPSTQLSVLPTLTPHVKILRTWKPIWQNRTTQQRNVTPGTQIQVLLLTHGCSFFPPRRSMMQQHQVCAAIPHLSDAVHLKPWYIVILSNGTGFIGTFITQRAGLINSDKNSLNNLVFIIINFCKHPLSEMKSAKNVHTWM